MTIPPPPDSGVRLRSHRMREILEEFAAHPIDVANEDAYVRVRGTDGGCRGWRLEAEFDIEDPAAMAAEVRRLEAIAVRARPAPTPVRPPRPAVRPCALCQAPTPQDTNPPRTYCSDRCRKRAHYLAHVSPARPVKQRQPRPAVTPRVRVPKPPAPPREIVCAQCRSGFTPPSGRTATYCSRACRRRADYEASLAAGRCTKCAMPAEPGKSRCRAHLDSAAEQQRKAA